MTTEFKLIDTATCEALPASPIDPRAAIDPTATVGPGCRIGPFAVIGPEVEIGAGCRIDGHAVITGPTRLGDDNVVHAFACLGGDPQDQRHRDERTTLEIGARNVFHEHVTVNRGTAHGGGRTVIGDDNMFMAYSHIAHDSRVGSRVVMANHATLAGHTTVEDHAVFGGMVGVGTFLRIGESTMLAAGAMIDRDVPPFCTVAGDRGRLYGINRVGLKRRGIDGLARDQLKRICAALRQRGTPLAEIIRRQEDDDARMTDEARRMLKFLKEATRGVTR
jgi:UDP-N-acetylglucosamine acyltransferase